MNTNARMAMIVILVVLFALSLGLFVSANYQTGMQGADLIVSTLLLAVPLALLYFSIGLMIQAWQERRSGGMSRQIAGALFYTPRIAGILVALFTGMFALDVFGEGGSLLEQIGAFLIHAAPAILMLIVIAAAWRWAWVGALVFGLAALFFMRSVFSSPGNLLLFILPMAAVATLFWMNWRWRGEVAAGGNRQKVAL